MRLQTGLFDENDKQLVSHIERGSACKSATMEDEVRLTVGAFCSVSASLAAASSFPSSSSSSAPKKKKIMTEKSVFHDYTVNKMVLLLSSPGCQFP